MAGCIIVVAQRVRDSLAHLPSITFQQVIFDKLFDLPWEDGDESVTRYQFPNDDMFEKFIESTAPVRGDPEELVGRYYEIIPTWYLPKKMPDLPPGREVTAKDIDRKEFFNEDVEPFSITLSEELLLRYPIMYHLDGCYVLSEAAWAVLGPHLTPPYCQSASVEV